MFLTKIEKIYAAAEKKIPPATDKIYEKKFKLKGYSMPVSVFQAHGGSDMGKILIYIFPKWTKADHLAAAFKHKRDYERLRGKWDNLADKAHMDTFGKERTVWDYRVSGIGDDKYPEEVKDKLRRLNTKNSKAAMLSGAHEEAAKLVGKVKVLREAVDEKVKKQA